MFCSKCGTKNSEKSTFCEKCGNKLEKEKKVKNSKIKDASSKIKKLPKKMKIAIGVAIIGIVVVVISLSILLNNPVKKVEDYLASYYDNYKENYDNYELVKIGDILKSNKDDKNTLDNIEKQIEKTITNWVKNFNKSYKDKEELSIEYDKLYNLLKEVYSYFNGLEYVLTYEEYYDYYEELYEIYNSKSNYFKAEEANNDYEKYEYFSKVIADDSYYKKAQEFVNNYLKDEIDNIKTETDKLVKLSEEATNEEWLNAYLEQLTYLNDNRYSNKIDLSKTEEYQKIYDNAVKNVLVYTKAYAEELDKELKTNDVMDMIEKSMDVLDYNSDEYNELKELKESYEDKLPDSLISKYLVSSTSGTSHSSYKITINDVAYDSYVSFAFKGETVSRTYRLNNEYKTFKASIIKGPDWDGDFEGEIVIYGDDKELYRSGKITKTGELNGDININISDVDDLKIEFVTESEPDGWSNFYIYLVEPYLYK